MISLDIGNSGIVRLTDAEQSVNNRPISSRASIARGAASAGVRLSLRRRMAGCRCAEAAAAPKRNWVRRAQESPDTAAGLEPAHGKTRGRSYSVVELITDDMPFLVTPCTALGSGYGVQLIAHPISCLRGANGACCTSRTQDGDADQRIVAVPAHRSRRGAHECAALRTNCWPRCWTCATPARDGGDAQPRWASRPTVAPAAAVPPPGGESAALLTYMEDNHFTFLGFRRSVCGARNGRIWKHSARAGICDPIRRAICAAARQARALVSPGNRRSTVHRPGYLDYVVVKEFDQRGR